MSHSLRRIFTRGVLDMATLEWDRSQEESYLYSGPIALCDDQLSTIVRSIEEIGTAARASGAKVEKQLTELKEKSAEQNQRLLEAEQTIVVLKKSGAGGGTHDAPTPSIGALIANHENMTAFRSGAQSAARIEIAQPLTRVLKSILTNTGQSGDSPQVNFPSAPLFLTPAPNQAPGRRLLVLQALAKQPVGPTAQAIVPKVTSTTDGSAVQQHEGSAKGESVISVTGAPLELPSIATYLNASKQVINDVVGLQFFLQAWLQFFVLRKLENLIIAGDGGSTDKILGLIDGGTVFTATEDHGVDRIGEACAIGLPAYGYAPGLIILSNLDYLRILAQRDANGRYVGGGWMAGLDTALWGCSAVSSPGCPVGTAIVLDTAMVSILEREVINFVVGWVNAQMISNEITLLAEGRWNLAINDPHAVQVVSLPVNSPNTVG
jgi:hypothetical protein